jgi:integrase
MPPRLENAVWPDLVCLPPQPSVRDLFAFHLADPTRRHSPENVAGYRRVVALVEQAFGPNLSLRDLDRTACRRFLALLIQTPAQFARRSPGMSLETAAQMSAAPSAGPLMRIATINTHMSKLSSLLNIAVEEGAIDRNPAKGLRLPDPLPASERRKPFSPAQLTAIFSSPLYLGCQDDAYRFARPGPAQPRRARFWAPLIGLFSGLRLNEILQLDVGDITRVEDQDCFLITRHSAHGGGDKRVKTPSGERFVPIHPALKDFGFMSYVDVRRAQGQLKLFPECKRSESSGLYSSRFSKGFRRFLESADAEAPRTSFHSFRHNFRDALRNGGVDSDLARVLCGWGAGGGARTATEYGVGYRVDRLAGAVAKVNYPGLDLTALSQANHRSAK